MARESCGALYVSRVTWTVVIWISNGKNTPKHPHLLIYSYGFDIGLKISLDHRTANKRDGELSVPVRNI